MYVRKYPGHVCTYYTVVYIGDTVISGNIANNYKSL